MPPDCIAPCAISFAVSDSMILLRRLCTLTAIASISAMLSITAGSAAGESGQLHPKQVDRTDATVPETEPLTSTQERLRLSRTPSIGSIVKFVAPPPGVSLRWLRNMRKPAFCPFVLCHGSCSDIIGQYTIGGSCPPTESAEEPVPCGLKTSLLFEGSSSGCCARSPGTVEGTTAGACVNAPSPTSGCH